MKGSITLVGMKCYHDWYNQKNLCYVVRLHDVKNTCNYKDFPLHGTHCDTLTSRRKLFIISTIMLCIDNNVVLIWNFLTENLKFEICQALIRTFSKHTPNEKRF